MAKALQSRIDRTNHYVCTDGGAASDPNLRPYAGYEGMERVQHQCIDFSNGSAVFVRGTYAMVLRPRLPISCSR